MALPSYTETRYRIWHYVYLTICAFVFFFLIDLFLVEEDFVILFAFLVLGI